MKTMIDKDMTTIAKAKAVKEALKEFKEMYTDGDLLRMFNEAVYNDWTPMYALGKILSVEVVGYPLCDWCNDIGVAVEITTLDRFVAAHFVRFYMDNSSGQWEIETDERLITHEKYGATREA